MTTVVVLVVGVMVVVIALAAVLAKSLESAVILLSAVSLLASVVFLLVAAPDVAITEAAIGSALTTVVFVLAVYRVRNAAPQDRNTPMHAADESSLAARAPRVAAPATTDTVTEQEKEVVDA